MFYVPRSSFYNPYYAAAPSYQLEPRDAEARYLRALHQERAARQAYEDSIADRLEAEDDAYNYVRRAPVYNAYDADADTGYGYGYEDDWRSAQRTRQASLARQATLARQNALARQALAAEQEQRRKARAYQQAKFYSDARDYQSVKPSHRKLGRVTPDVRSGAAYTDSAAEPVRIPIRGSSPPHASSPKAPASASEAPRAASPSPPESTVTPPPESALAAISTIESMLSTLRSSFSLPPSLDFVAPQELSYASQNAPIRSYEHQLGLLLEKLDEIESAGVAEIRKERKRVVELVENALEEVDALVKEEWRKAHPEDRAATEVHVHSEDSMTVEPSGSTSAPVLEDVPQVGEVAVLDDSMEVETREAEGVASSPSPAVAPIAEDTDVIEEEAAPSSSDIVVDVSPRASGHSLDPIVEEPTSDNEDSLTVHESVVLPDASLELSAAQQDTRDYSRLPTEVLVLTDSVEYPPQERIEDYEMIEH